MVQSKKATKLFDFAGIIDSIGVSMPRNYKLFLSGSGGRKRCRLLHLGNLSLTSGARRKGDKELEPDGTSKGKRLEDRIQGKHSQTGLLLYSFPEL